MSCPARAARAARAAAAQPAAPPPPPTVATEACVTDSSTRPRRRRPPRRGLAAARAAPAPAALAAAAAALAPTVPPFAPLNYLCNDLCLVPTFVGTSVRLVDYTNDGHCDDGGEGAAYAACPYGADCADCLGRNLVDCDYVCERKDSAADAANHCASVQQTEHGTIDVDRTAGTRGCFLSAWDLSRTDAGRAPPPPPSSPPDTPMQLLYACRCRHHSPPRRRPARRRPRGCPSSTCACSLRTTGSISPNR